MEIPISWVLGIIGTLAATISTLAVVIYKSLENRIAAQNTIIAAQNRNIRNLQEDIKRLSQGCGIESCIWKSARILTPPFSHSDEEPCGKGECEPVG